MQLNSASMKGQSLFDYKYDHSLGGLEVQTPKFHHLLFLLHCIKKAVSFYLKMQWSICIPGS